ncbi:MAG: hypothetical protein IH612_08785, partial [Desulfofustis sp.]|nr:hypothetical protein [Desulfofustis sp.]
MRKLFIAVLVAVVLSTALGAVLLLSSTGLTTAVRLVTTLSGGLLTIGESHGRLAGDWRLNNVMLALPDSRVTIEELACRWHPRELLHGRLSIADLTARRVTVTVDSQGQQ